jgi:hypothetical protein
MATRSKSTSAKSKAARAPTKKSAGRTTAIPRAKTANRATQAKTPAKRAQRKPADTSKQSRLITMLRSEPGATIEQMVKLTGWQPHTVRAVISSALRKRLGLNVMANTADDGRKRVYRIVSTPAAA